MSDNKKMRPKNIDAKKLTDEEMGSVNGGKAQMMSVFCTHCQQNFTADVSLNMVFCTHCGMPTLLFG